MAEVKISELDEKEVDTILAEDIDFSGVLTFRNPLMIKGKSALPPLRVNTTVSLPSALMSLIGSTIPLAADLDFSPL